MHSAYFEEAISHFNLARYETKLATLKTAFINLIDAIVIDLQLNMISGRLPPIPSQRSEQKLTKPVLKQPLEVL